MTSLRSPRVAFLSVLLVIPLAADLTAQRGGGGWKKPEPKGTFVVAQAGDAIAIIRKSEVAWTRSMLDREFGRAMADYREAVKDAQKAKQKFEGKPPERKKLEVLNDKSKTEDEARRLLDRYLKAAKKKDPKSTLHEGALTSRGGLGERGREGREGKESEGKKGDKPQDGRPDGNGPDGAEPEAKEGGKKEGGPKEGDEPGPKPGEGKKG